MKIPFFIFNRRFFSIFILTLFATVGTIHSASAKPNRVAIIPFEINAEDDLSFLKDGIVDMLTSRLFWEERVVISGKEETGKALEAVEKPLNETKIHEIGVRLGVDYVIFGSLTVLGESVSIDVRMLDVSGERPVVTFFNQGRGMGEVISQINILAEEINHKVFGRRMVTMPLPEETLREKPFVRAHPERIFREGLMEPGIKEDELSPFVMAHDDKRAAGFWKSKDFRIQIKGISLGDVDGDGKTELVIISSQKILIYRFENGHFSKIEEIPSERHQRLIAVDVADIKRDGRAEIFVTSLNITDRSLDSSVLEWDGDSFRYIATGENWYYRVLVHHDGETLLLGQKRSVTSTFFSGVYRLAWDGKKYKPQERVHLPKGITVFGFAMGDVMNDGSRMVVAFDRDDRLRIFDPAGREVWRSDEQYGGSENYLKDISDRESEDLIYLPHRIFITDLNRDGKKEVVTVKNHSVTGRLFERYRRYNSGQFELLSWDGLGLSQDWHTRKVSGYFSDYAVGDIDNDGKPELVASVVSRRGSIIRQPKSSIIVYNLKEHLKDW